MTMFTRPSHGEQNSAAPNGHVELYTPPELDPYMDDARAVATATLEGPSGRNWRSHLEARIHGHVAAAIVAVSYTGIRPGDLPRPTLVRRSVVEPYFGRTLVGEWTDDKTAQSENAAASRAYRADQEAREEFHQAVASTVDEILSDPVRAQAAHMHFLALEEAERRLERDRESTAAALEMTVRYTDPISGVCEPGHGEIARRSVLPGATLPQYENTDPWYSIESSALTHLLVQHRLAQRVLDRRPDLAKSVDRLVDELMRGANL